MPTLSLSSCDLFHRLTSLTDSLFLLSIELFQSHRHLFRFLAAASKRARFDKKLWILCKTLDNVSLVVSSVRIVNSRAFPVIFSNGEALITMRIVAFYSFS